MGQDQYKELVDSLPEIIFELDENGIITYINSAGASILGYSIDELMGKPSTDLISANDRDRSLRRITDLLSGAAANTAGELALVVKDGSKSIPCKISVTSVVKNGKSCGVRGVVVDITTLKEMEERLLKSEERFRKISDMAQEGIVFHNDGVIIDANRAFAEMFGYQLEEVINRQLMGFVPAEFHDAIREYITAKDTLPCITKGVKKFGDTFDIEFTMKSFFQDGKKIFAVVVRDISYRKRIEYFEEHDELTDLVNARGFMKILKDSVESARQRQKKLAVVTIRYCPDRLSIVKGVSPELERILYNVVPLEITERLKSTLFKEDVIARTADNEFITIHTLPGNHVVGNSVKLIQKLLGVFSTEFLKGIRLIPSVGVTFIPDDTESGSPVKMIQNSRYACEEAVLQEREYVFYDEHSHRETRERIEFVKDLIIAVREEECKNFMLYYQPKVNSQLQIMGMEALIRWKHPRWNIQPDGCVPPMMFITVAEDTSLIIDIGKWVLKEACQQTKEWQDKCDRLKSLQVAVNVSPKQLNEEFLEYLDKVLEKTGLSPESLELEITERETLKDKNVQIIEKIKEKHIAIAIDDFGINYSSLSRLPKLPISTIKLDKSYIEKIAVDSDYEHLVDSTIKMVHGFKYNVVAEGVEDKDQADKLFFTMSCDKIQGYYYSAPVSVEDFEKMILSKEKIW